MNKYSFICWAIVYSCITLSCFAENKFKNPEFDQAFNGECRIENTAENQATVKLFTEDATWNRCARFELLKILQTKNSQQHVAASMALGGDKKKLGFEVKPDTTYEFSIELKGTAHKMYLKANEFTGSDIWKNRKAIKIASNHPINLSMDWQQYKGRFTTGPKAKRVILIIQMWWDTQYGPMRYQVGDYILIDKVVIQKVADPLKAFKNNPQARQTVQRPVAIAPFTHAQIILDGKLDEEAWQQANTQSQFVGLYHQPIKQQTSFKALASEDGLYLGVVCNESVIQKLKANISSSGDQKIWQDDVIEIFFGPVVNDRKFSQFVLSPGGGKWRTIGNAQSLTNDQWKQATTKDEHSWSAEVFIPYRILGWDGLPKSGKWMAFNIARQRQPVAELSTWSKLDQSFHEVHHFGKLILGNFKDYASMQISQLQNKDINAFTPNDIKTIQPQIDRLKNINDPSIFEQAYRQIKKTIKQVSYENRRFFVTQVPTTHAPQAPLIPNNLSMDSPTIKARGAINDTKNIALAITNVTNQTQEYRVLIHDGKSYGNENIGLFNEDGEAFPLDQIRLMRGVRVKDRDAGRVVQLFDPLVELDDINSVFAGSMDSAMIWIQLHFQDVKPGKYKGFFRVIPLGEPSKIYHSSSPGNLKGWKYEGEMIDLPIEINVLPFAITKDPIIPWDVMRVANNQNTFDTMAQQGVRTFIFTCWLIQPQFNEDGSIKSFDSSRFNHEIQRHIQWAKKSNVLDQIKWGLGLSCYGNFMNHFGGSAFKVGTKAWERAWKNYVMATAQAFKTNGISLSDVYMEIIDEPQGQMQNKKLDLQTLVTVYRLAKQAVPAIQTYSWFDVHTPAAGYPELMPYIDAWGFYATALLAPEYQQLVETLRQQNKKIWLYQCQVNTNADLYHYYRKHAWIAYHAKADRIGFFVYSDPYEGGWASFSWKKVPEGGLVYRSGDKLITSIRNENLKTGDRDIRYLNYLNQILNKTPKQTEQVHEARKFITQATHQVLISQSHDRTYADQIIEKAINYTLELMHKPTNN